MRGVWGGTSPEPQQVVGREQQCRAGIRMHLCQSNLPVVRETEVGKTCREQLGTWRDEFWKPLCHSPVTRTVHGKTEE